jgi:uncharacterized membrane protein
LKKIITIFNAVNRLDAHHKLYISLGVALVVFGATYSNVSTHMHVMLSWLAYSMTTIILTWVTILTSHPAQVKQEAHAQDSSKKLVFCFVIAAAFASLLAVVMLLMDKGSHSRTNNSLEILATISCVVSSWWLVHTVFTLRYAHYFYGDVDHLSKGRNRKPGGLTFPNEDQPDYLDFTYFSFVIGMTFQVSDVEITSRKIRRLAWMHGVLAFAFNTVIVAFSINIISSLIQK